MHNHAEAWVAQVSGRKGWYLDPGTLPLPPGVPELSQELGKEGWLCDLDVDALNRGNAAIVQGKAARVKHCALELGEVVYVPDLWRHGTCYLTPHSITAGYIGAVDRFPTEIHQAAFDGDVPMLRQC